MKTRSDFVGKVFYLFLLAVLALCICTPVLAASSTTTLTTTVPTYFHMSVKIVGKGTIELNGKIMSETGVAQVERNKDVFITITPGAGYHISSVVYDDVDITQEIKDGHLTLSQLDGEASFDVKFVANTSVPSTGDASYSSVVFLSVAAIISLLGIVVLLTVNRKKSNRM